MTKHKELNMKTRINQIMKYLLLLALVILSPLFAKAGVLYPGQTVEISFEPTTGEYGPIWTTDNPTLQLSGIGFRCNVTAQAYFGGSATITCTYNDRIGYTTYTRTRRWTFTCIDTQISISPASKSIRMGETFQISCSYNRATYITPSVQFTGYDNSIVDVSSSGTVTAKSKGMTEIYVKSNLGTNSVVCTVNVLDSKSDGSSSGNQSSYDNWDSSKTKTIKLEKAGTLSEYITESNKYLITDLTIIGPLNGTDMRLLRDMAGCDHYRKTTNGKLEALDLKEAYFVGGGQWYYASGNADTGYQYSYTSSTGAIPMEAFFLCESLKRIRFPKYCTNIPDAATRGACNLEYIAMSPGTTKVGCLYGLWKTFAMQTLTLPSTVVEFSSPYKCDNLTDVYCYATNPPEISSESSFISQTNCMNGVLYVPKGCSEAYWRAKGWRSFSDIQETLDVFNTLSIIVGENGIVRYNGEAIEVKQSIAYTGKQAFEVLNGEDVIVEVTPKNGFCISKMTLDGQSIDIPMNTEIFNLGKLSKHSQLSVQFSQQTLITGIKLPASITLKEEETKTLYATILPENATNKSLTWSSSDESVAIVDHTGKITAISPGDASVTAIANDGSGVTASCEVTVLPASYVITYLVDGEVFAADTLSCGSSITLPEEPTKEGYTFSGWSEVPETMPAKDITVSGTFTVNKYQVTFKIDGVVIASYTQSYGSTIVAPEVPEKEGHTFDGWGEVAETVPASDVTYEGSYSVNSYTITYLVDGEVVHSESVTYGTTIIALEEPYKEGHTFSGWSGLPETMPAKDITVSATFTVNKYQVTFKIDGVVIANYTQDYGSAIVAPDAPEREGYTFNGWGEVAETVPASDVTYEGTYTVNIYKVYYYVGEELVHTAEVAYGEAIPEYIYEPEEEGYTFLGWIGETYATMPAHDVTYTANIDNGIGTLTIDYSQLNIYDLTGRKVTDTENLKGGIYIVNGRKVVIND